MAASKTKIIGIAGTNGSGKDTMGDLLARYHNYLFVSVTELLREEASRRGLKVERKNLSMISAEWRRQSGFGVLVDRALNEFDKVQDKYDGLAIASLRHPGENDRIHELGGVVVWLDADPKIRYQRIKESSHMRSHRAHEDDKTFEEFMAEEQAEMHQSGDEATLNMTAVKEKADVYLDNSGETTEEFKIQMEKALYL